jgi:hypothetical protein
MCHLMVISFNRAVESPINKKEKGRTVVWTTSASSFMKIEKFFRFHLSFSDDTPTEKDQVDSCELGSILM